MTLDYWTPSERTIKYRVRWYAGHIMHKDFPPTDKGLVKLVEWFEENKPPFGTEILVLMLSNLRYTGEKIWVRLPYSMPITAVLGYLKDKGLITQKILEKSGGT